jgi:hypothetical protein
VDLLRFDKIAQGHQKESFSPLQRTERALGCDPDLESERNVVSILASDKVGVEFQNPCFVLVFFDSVQFSFTTQQIQKPT